MVVKEKLRKKFLKKRKLNYFKIEPSFFNPLIKLIKKKFKRKKISLSIYYPSNFEVDTLQILKNSYMNWVSVPIPYG